MQGRRLEPGSDTLIFRIFLFIPKKKYVRAFSQPKSTNQPVVIFGIMCNNEVRKKKKSALVIMQVFLGRSPFLSLTLTLLDGSQWDW